MQSLPIRHQSADEKDVPFDINEYNDLYGGTGGKPKFQSAKV